MVRFSSWCFRLRDQGPERFPRFAVMGAICRCNGGQQQVIELEPEIKGGQLVAGEQHAGVFDQLVHRARHRAIQRRGEPNDAHAVSYSFGVSCGNEQVLTGRSRSW